jgi:hypothetical protein
MNAYLNTIHLKVLLKVYADLTYIDTTFKILQATGIPRLFLRRFGVYCRWLCRVIALTLIEDCDNFSAT